MNSKSISSLSVFLLGIFLCSISAVNAADVTVSVNASSYIRAIPETMYGTNMHCWDGAQNGGNENFNNLMAASGRRYVRWPGGSWGDAYLWSNMEWNDVNVWIVSYDESMYLLNRLDKILQPIVNFKGFWNDANHLPEGITSAVAFVQDQSSRIPTARYWEIGNETFGRTWEGGSDANICGTYYGSRFADFYTPMKVANSRIKIGAVAQEYNQADWWNPGLWTRDLLDAAKAKSVVPDFLIIHQYPGVGQDASYNPTLLGHDVDEIANYTSSLNSIIAGTIGSQYIGKIKYYMTEWDSGWNTGSNPYDKHICYVNAMFHSQYILEMAKNNWEGSNEWSQWEYTNFVVYPVWYVAPMLINHFGRDMVAATSTNSMVRVYASRDEANNITIFMVNNYPSTDRTVHIDISGFAAGTGGVRWLIEPAGTIVSGGSTIQDYNDVNINGVIHPNTSTIATLSGISITTGNSFDVSLPRSRMLLIKIPPVAPAEQLPYEGVVGAIPGTIEAEDYDIGGQFTAYYETTASNSSGQYRSDDVDIETCGEGGFDVTGIKVGEWLEYTVDVESSGIYKIQARAASADSNGAFRIEFDGRDVTGPVNFPATGGAQTYTNVDVNHVFLKTGEHRMRLLMDANDWNINRINFTRLGDGTGKALREWWSKIGSGGAVSNLTSDVNYPWNPTGREMARSFEGPVYSETNSGTRIRGYLHPIADGNYTFWIASDDASELWLSTDADPVHKTRIARVSSWCNPYKWDKNAEQKSSTISLAAGQEYYLEVLHKQGGGGNNIAVGWQGPDIIRQAITGPYLTPYIIDFADFANFGSQWNRSGCVTSNAWCSGADYDHNGNVGLDDLMEFVESWWLFGDE
jgi:hypothetical protein